MRIGEIEIQPIHDGIGREDPAAFLARPGVPDAWACHRDHLGAHGMLHLDLGGFLVRTADRVILIDTGVGSIDNGRYVGGGFLASLRGLGVEPRDVTDVAFTHLHYDHVGWATQRGEVVFPKATYRVHLADWHHFVESPDAVAGAVRKLTPLEPRLELFERDVVIAPGVSVRHSPGHTPGSVVYIVAHGGARALLLGDVVHSIVELEDRDWEMLHDVDPVGASAVRNAIADEVADTSDVVAGGHFPGLGFGRVITSTGSRTFHAI